MIDYKMELAQDQIDILEGKKGDTLRKMMETLVLFGDIFGAKRMVPVTHKEGHLVTSFGIPLLRPLFKTMEEINKEGLKAEGGFTCDPAPLDYENVKCNLLEKVVFNKILYGKQEEYTEQMLKAGLVDKDSFSCTCYLEECGNRPKKGDILSWAESSAVVFANSVLGARCNRNSGMLDLFGSIIGYVPEFGLLLDENRKATWIVEVKTSKVPEAQILGSAIGMKVMEEVPYIKGLDRFIGSELDHENEAYLKDMGAASASNGAVGLFHVENLTPEAKESGENLISPNAKKYIIDDTELDRVYKSYPNMWKKKDANPEITFIIKENESLYKEVYDYGVRLSSICPLMYTNNPLVHGKAILTNSNKLRTYSMARYFKDDEILELITK